MKNNIREYLVHHNACEDGLEWCVQNCASMEEVWKKLERYDWMMWLISDAKCLTDRECHEFGLWCTEQVRHLMEDPRSVAALKAKRDWLDGRITDEELYIAKLSARGAVREAAREAREAREAAWEATAATSSAAAWIAARAGEAAWEAARAAARAAAACSEIAAAAAEESREESQVVTWKAVETAQLAWLRANTKPVFRMEDA